MNTERVTVLPTKFRNAGSWPSSSETPVQPLPHRNRQDDTYTLLERFLDAGEDLVLVGHTHTYERFRVQRDDRQFDLVDVSGRPRTSRLAIVDGEEETICERVELR